MTKRRTEKFLSQRLVLFLPHILWPDNIAFFGQPRRAFTMAIVLVLDIFFLIKELYLSNIKKRKPPIFGFFFLN